MTQHNGVTVRHLTFEQSIIQSTVDLLYLYLRNLITKGVSSSFWRKWTKEQRVTTKIIKMIWSETEICSMYNFFSAKNFTSPFFTVKYLLTNFIVPSYKVLLFFKIKVDLYLQQFPARWGLAASDKTKLTLAPVFGIITWCRCSS